MNAKTCFVPIENIHSPAEARNQGGLTMDSPGPSSLLPVPTPTPDPPLPPDPSPFPGPPVEITSSPTLLSCGAGFAHVGASTGTSCHNTAAEYRAAPTAAQTRSRAPRGPQD